MRTCSRGSSTLEHDAARPGRQRYARVQSCMLIACMTDDCCCTSEQDVARLKLHSPKPRVPSGVYQMTGIVASIFLSGTSYTTLGLSTPGVALPVLQSSRSAVTHGAFACRVTVQHNRSGWLSPTATSRATTARGPARSSRRRRHERHCVLVFGADMRVARARPRCGLVQSAPWNPNPCSPSTAPL